MILKREDVMSQTPLSESTTARQGRKKIHIETWGCQMNIADSERIAAMMKGENYELSEKPEQADLIILNTCHIREKARHKVLSRLGVLKELKAHHPGLKIAVAGCVAQAEGKKLLKQAPVVDILVGPGKISSIPSLLRRHQESGAQEIAIGFPGPEVSGSRSPEGACHESQLVPESLGGKNEVSRFVNIQQGCDNFCTFCVVPFTRGREVSERPEVIYAKSKAMVLHGAKEIMLLGQNVNSYGVDLVRSDRLKVGDGEAFVGLLRKVAKVPGLQRLRFTTSNPHDLTQELANLFAELPVLGRYYHLPVQSGSDRILAQMRRKVTAGEYLTKVSWLRQAAPDIALSTDLIVGFPGETEEDFARTLALLRQVRFSFVYAFMYSRRKGTAAIRFKDQIPEDVKADRLARLNQAQDAITIELNQQELGQRREVLFLYESKKEPGIWYGRTEHFRLVRVASDRALTGVLAMVRIDGCNKTALTGYLEDDACG